MGEKRAKNEQQMSEKMGETSESNFPQIGGKKLKVGKRAFS